MPKKQSTTPEQDKRVKVTAPFTANERRLAMLEKVVVHLDNRIDALEAALLRVGAAAGCVQSAVVDE